MRKIIVQPRGLGCINIVGDISLACSKDNVWVYIGGSRALLLTYPNHADALADYEEFEGKEDGELTVLTPRDAELI